MSQSSPVSETVSDALEQARAYIEHDVETLAPGWRTAQAIIELIDAAIVSSDHAPRSWTPDRDAIYRAIENNVRSVPDENFIDRRWMVGINDAIDAILALADTSTDRTWHEAMADRVLQLKIGGAKNLSCDAVLGLIAFIRDGEGSVAVSSPERDPEAERTKLSNERKRLRRWGIGQ